MLGWEKQEIDGYLAWIGRTELMEIIVVPQLGSKAISLKHRKTNREWLSRTELPLGNRGYASSFSDSDGSGWDEMFPTINPCRYGEYPWQGVELPDHGEVWSIPWQAMVDNQQLQCEVYGVRMPYQLRKTYSFRTAERLRIDYSVQNLSPFPFSFLWAAHPLFQVVEGMEIRVPADLNQIVVSYSQHGRLGETGDKLAWPNPFGEASPTPLNRVEADTARTAEKYYFAEELPEGKASLYDPRTGEQMTMYFPIEQVPYLSIWANYGGYLGQYHVAIEPATGFLDDVSYAMEQGKAAYVEAGGTYSWFLELELSQNT
ncbi:hypothetical protein BVG16_24935 [Paenibacillus selenitireducens]|uniref:Galactose mutarotase n=1 Tax=Paenibacillus selenitireducens TaxID=1324314 RepID=A0A1T2X286_9BACL|nr:DUF4432 family protein [Paenibacillus selenitireducens]OPA74008.1 hypothetical protein BVG16_24935 [Paenibacillus selenitireducens]